jgi:hypothetical protein
MKTKMNVGTSTMKPQYPRVMRYIGENFSQTKKELVVLFTDEHTGICIHVNCVCRKLGEYDNNWVLASDRMSWVPFVGSIEFDN